MKAALVRSEKMEAGMLTLSNQIREVTDCLIGKYLSHLAHAGNMRGFHFGSVRRIDGRVVGEFALHVQCPWRIEVRGRVATGFQDYYAPASGEDEEEWVPGGKGRNLQEEVLSRLFRVEAAKNSAAQGTVRGMKRVLSTRGDSYGGLVVNFTGGVRLRVFPAASTEEHWRLFQPKKRARHFVVSGGEAHYE